jgi:drug/metabolite transporter (DMT)-like permease
MLAARLEVMLAALLFSTGGAAIKATALSSWQVASLRSAIAAMLLLAVARGRVRITRQSWLVGLAYGITLVTFVTANKLTTAASAVFLQAAAPLYLLLLGPRLLGERLHLRDVPFMLVILTGLAMLLGGSDAAASATAPNPRLGNLIGLVSGLSWALTLAGLRWIEQTHASHGATATSATICGNLTAAALALPLAWPFAGVAASDWLTVGYLGVFQVGFAYVLLNRAIRQVPALEASLLLLLEPAVNPLWAWWVHGEWPGWLASAGGVLIVTATTARTVARQRRVAARPK